MNNRQYNERRSQLASVMSASLLAVSENAVKNSKELDPASADKVAFAFVELVETLCHERSRQESAGKWVIDPITIPAEVFTGYVAYEADRLNGGFTEGDDDVELFDIIKELKRDTIRHNLRADGYRVWGAVNGHELYGMEGESSAYAQHSDACGCMWLDAGDEPWEPMGDW
jgi:hypothetical protein